MVAGMRFRQLVEQTTPLQVVGTINAYCAKLAEFSGVQAIYLSGSGVATASYGLPDLGITQLKDVLEDVSRITAATELPLLVDIDTGFGQGFIIARTIKEMIRAGAAAVHIEDQVTAKRCGHRPQKSIVPCEEMVDRIKAAVDARTDPNFVIMARTDAFANEGLSGAIDRAGAYIEAGADMIFPEALYELEHYHAFSKAIQVPMLANITEFGKTPLFNQEQLASVGVGLILYPLTAFRMMSQVALEAYETIITEGSQASLIDKMQTRDKLYECLNYHEYEARLDRLTRKGD